MHSTISMQILPDMIIFDEILLEVHYKVSIFALGTSEKVHYREKSIIEKSKESFFVHKVY